MAVSVGWDDEDLVLWLCTPSRYFEGDRPVDHLDDEDLIAKANAAATIRW
jgi:hypothetical protein